MSAWDRLIPKTQLAEVRKVTGEMDRLKNPQLYFDAAMEQARAVVSAWYSGDGVPQMTGEVQERLVVAVADALACRGGAAARHGKENG